MEIDIYFGGFYETAHSNVLENAADLAHMDDYGNVQDYSLPWGVWHKMKVEYCKAVVDFVNQEAGTNLAYKSFWSPREYNFSTDYISAEASVKDVLILMQWLFTTIDRQEAAERVLSSSSMRAGFLPFNTPEELVSYNYKLIPVLLESVLDDMQDDIISYMDVQHINDRLLELIIGEM